MMVESGLTEFKSWGSYACLSMCLLRSPLLCSFLSLFLFVNATVFVRVSVWFQSIAFVSMLEQKLFFILVPIKHLLHSHNKIPPLINMFCIL